MSMPACDQVGLGPGQGVLCHRALRLDQDVDLGRPDVAVPPGLSGERQARKGPAPAQLGPGLFLWEMAASCRPRRVALSAPSRPHPFHWSNSASDSLTAQLSRFCSRSTKMIVSGSQRSEGGVARYVVDGGAQVGQGNAGGVGA